MSAMSDPLFLKACRGERVDRIPVWFMRQAGRSLPGYRKLRTQYDLLTLTRTPELAAQVSMEPISLLGVDAAILFADIMLLPIAMGVEVVIVEAVGPVIDTPLNVPEKIARLRPFSPEKISFLSETIKILRGELNVPLIGFSGAPFTLASYLIEGKPTRTWLATKQFMLTYPDAWQTLMGALSDGVIGYLRAQIAAGVQAVQMFDSWVGCLSPTEYRAYVLPHMQRIFSSLKDSGVPRIHFGTNTAGMLKDFSDVDCEVIGVDWRMDLAAAQRAIGGKVLQGLLHGTRFSNQWTTCSEILTPSGAIFSILVMAYRRRQTMSSSKSLWITFMENRTGVVIMTYGSATTAAHVRDYFENIYHGKASEALIQDFENRYRLVGRSPLVEITEKQADLLQKNLSAGNAGSFVVRAGMRHSAPWIRDVVAACRVEGATRLIGIVLSPQFSSVIMEGYRTSFAHAAKENGFADAATVIAGPWPTEPHFIELLAQRTLAALQKLHEQYGARIPVVFTTHSLPESVVAKDPSYMEQLTATINAVRAKLGARLTEWYAGYQSAGHTPEAWLKPDLTDILHEISAEGARGVLIVPIQFLADHLEILYDLDIAAKAQCEERGIAYHRIELPNTDPLCIEALRAVVLNATANLSR
jgi:uroporphyrinogen decarboxylase/ferrochelatase